MTRSAPRPPLPDMRRRRCQEFRTVIHEQRQAAGSLSDELRGSQRRARDVALGGALASPMRCGCGSASQVTSAAVEASRN